MKETLSIIYVTMFIVFKLCVAVAPIGEVEIVGADKITIVALALLLYTGLILSLIHIIYRQ